MQQQFPAHLQALTTIALTLDGDEAMQLFKFLPKEEEELIKPRAEKFLALSEADRRSSSSTGLKALRSEFLLRQITDVHPSHIALVLTNEPAPIIRIIFHHLPAELVTEVMQHLGERTIRKLEACPEAPQIAPELIEVVKDGFIRQFTFILPGENPLTRFNTPRLRALLREMSLQTIAIAMRRINRDELVASLQRFPRTFSKEVVRRLKLLREVEIDQVFLAEKSLVWLTTQQLRNFSITEDTGFMLLAGGLLNESESLQKFITQKFSIEESGRFYDLLGRLNQADNTLISFARDQVRQAISVILQARQPLIPNSARNETPATPNSANAPTPSTNAPTVKSTK
jgi:flagellar motor switch protein FliG